ncbi:hypothetical protein R6Q57_011245 [Mikania cordata]
MACAEKMVFLSFCPSLVHRLLLSKAQNVPFRIAQSLHKAVVTAQNEGQFAMAHVLRPKVYFFPRDVMMDGYDWREKVYCLKVKMNTSVVVS